VSALSVRRSSAIVLRRRNHRKCIACQMLIAAALGEARRGLIAYDSLRQSK
jgi:hypothetical protein